MKIVWLAPFDVTTLEPELSLARYLASHSCSWIVNLSTQLAESPDHELHLVTESPLVAKNSIVRKNNITYHIIKSGVPFTNRGFPGYFNAEVFARYAFNRKRLAAYVKRLRPDIIHSYGTENAYSLAALSSGYPFIVSMQGILNHILEDDTGIKNRILMQLELELVQKASFFDCRTNLDADFVRSHNPNARIFTIHRAIHSAFFNVDWQLSNTKQLLFVGSVVKRKGIEVALDAFEQVAKSFPEVSLCVIGAVAESYKRMLLAKIDSDRFRKNICFLGHCNTERIALEHLKSRLLIFPSFMDNSPNGVAEALVSGLPVIASRVGGIPSMVSHNESGILVEMDNGNLLAEAILKLFRNEGESLRLSKNAKQVAYERYHPANVAKSAFNAYNEIIATSASTRNKSFILH